MSPGSARRAPLLIPRPFVKQLLQLYDMPDPRCRTRLIRGYDGSHAVRTARMCAAVAQRLGYAPEIVERYQIACLLHDLGRETEAFLARYRKDLEAAGINMEPWACEQVEMRLGYARRLARRLRQVQPRLTQLGVVWSPWMKQVMLYYYYPEKLVRARPWVKRLAEVLVACEQFEAYSNQRRGRDYYVRVKENLPEAFAYLEKLQREGLLSRAVVAALQRLAAEGEFDQILTEARGMPLSRRERLWLRRSCVKET